MKDNITELKNIGSATKNKKNKNKKKVHIEKNTMVRARSKLKEQGICSNSNIVILKDNKEDKNKLCFDFIRQN